ncbi:MAG: type II toxin-antitoxin system VapC family toxin [Pseudomonadota bacterium]
MNVVDSSAWLSYLAGDRNAGKFAKAIEDLDRLLVPSITLTEVFKIVFRQSGEEMALAVVAHMEQGRVIPLDAQLAVDAASCGLAYKLPLADSIVYATARKFDATIWTQDIDFKPLRGVRYIAKA